MKKFLILALSIAIIGSAWGQCTIRNATILNPHTGSGVTTFDLQFKHDRNWGNKWVTIHFWSTALYPGYDYDRVPTTTRLGGVMKRPFGTVVINNENVDRSGTYSAAEAYAGIYQNDAAFLMLNTSASTLIYNSSTDVYTLKNLKMIVPSGSTVIKFDSWSSQSDGNNNVHCYSTCGDIPVPTAMGVTGLNTFQAVFLERQVKFTWTTHMESNNSYFLVQEYKDSTWYDVGMVTSKYEDGNCAHDTEYQYIYSPFKTNHAGLTGYWPILLIFAFLFRRIVPARLTLLVFLACMGASIACKSGSALQDSLQTDHMYRLKQVDKDGKSDLSHTEFVRF